MSFLSAAFAAAAALVVVPVVLHLIRRAPRDRQEFSSLMFLEPSPPELTKRSRLDDLPLLLLRSLAVVAIAIAFARPFLTDDETTTTQTGVRRVVLVVDTSASVAESWDAAVAAASAALDEAGPSDRWSLVTFDRKPVVRHRFSDEDEPAHRRLIGETLRTVQPTHASTDLAAALLRAIDLLDEASEDGIVALQIVLVSDFQEGAERQRLQGIDWPAEVAVDVRPIETPATNVSVTVIESSEGEASDPPRLRIANTARSERERFTIAWDAGEPTAVTIPAGESRVFKLPRPEPAAAIVTAGGDDATFDNRLFVAPRPPQPVTIRFLGPDGADDPEGPFLYASLALGDTDRRQVIRQFGPDAESAEPADLVIITSQPSEVARIGVEASLAAGASVVVLPSSSAEAKRLDWLIGPIRRTEASTERDRLLAEIDFADPLFAPFAGPRFSDFTDVRFWAARPIAPAGDATVVASFDDGVPWLWRRRPERGGRVFVLTSGWQPGDSQLGAAAKFVPLIEQMLAPALPVRASDRALVVGDAVPVPPGDDRTIIQPDGDEVTLAVDVQQFDRTALPGLYTLIVDGEESTFAVNIDPDESRTTPIEPADLATLGVRLGAATPSPDARDRERRLRDAELEGRQQWWRWLLLVALALLGAETTLAGFRSRSTPATPVQ